MENMCGICGIYIFKDKKPQRESLIKMCRCLEHRGPDDEGVYIDSKVGLASRRLSIIDLKTGRQPIRNEDKSLWVVLNGEIYNFPQLREELQRKGHRFYTKSDTECIAHLYEERGSNCFKDLDGMFAIALWDSQKKKVILARDPMGQKPLYWTIFENKLLFASEIKSILAFPGFEKKPNLQAISNYFFYSFIPSPSTAFKGIQKLRPGFFLEVDAKGRAREEKYWDIDYSKKLTDISEEEIKQKIIHLLKNSIQKRLMSDVPLGVFLSGGIDSGLIAALMREFIPASQIDAFTIGFSDDSFDESSLAKETASVLGVRHYLEVINPKDALEMIPDLIKTLDEPFGDPSVLPTLLLSKFAQEKVKVALSGDGGDESFAGYPKYLAHQWLEGGFGRIIKKLPSMGTPRMKSFLKFANQPLYLRNQLWISSFALEEIKNITGCEADLNDLTSYHQEFCGQEPLDEAFYLDQKLTLADLYLTKVDRASMAVSLEVRCPFLDRNLVEFAAQIPVFRKMKNFRTKYLLKEIAKGYLPKEAIGQTKKGFGIPLEAWLSGDLKPLLDEYLSKGNPSDNSFATWKRLVFKIWSKHWLA